MGQESHGEREVWEGKGALGESPISCPASQVPRAGQRKLKRRTLSWSRSRSRPRANVQWVRVATTNRMSNL